LALSLHIQNNHLIPGAVSSPQICPPKMKLRFAHYHRETWRVGVHEKKSTMLKFVPGPRQLAEPNPSVLKGNLASDK